MRRVLIVWGGWPGHFPAEGAKIIAELLAAEGFEPTVTGDYAAFGGAGAFDLVVPVITNDQIDGDIVTRLSAAVRNGTGLAGYHGGLAASFRSAVNFHFMCGVQWVAHPGNMAARYRVRVTKPDDPIMQGIGDFDYASEQYYLHYDPSVEILATTRFSGEFDAATTGIEMPVVLKRRFGEGRIFYSALGHDPAELSHPEAREILRRGFVWAARNAVPEDL